MGLISSYKDSRLEAENRSAKHQARQQYTTNRQANWLETNCRRQKTVPDTKPKEQPKIEINYSTNRKPKTTYEHRLFCASGFSAVHVIHVTTALHYGLLFKKCHRCNLTTSHTVATCASEELIFNLGTDSQFPQRRPDSQVFTPLNSQAWLDGWLRSGPRLPGVVSWPQPAHLFQPASALCRGRA